MVSCEKFTLKLLVLHLLVETALVFLKKERNILFIYFRQRGGEGEREGKKHQCVVASQASPIGNLTWPTKQASTLTGNQTRDPLFCRPVLNPLSHSSQGQMALVLREE